jgi:hypothetical protein
MTPEDEVLLEMYKAQVARSEHYESLRAAIGSTLAVVAAGLVGLAAFDGKLTENDLISGLALVVVGVFGVVATRAHSDRARRHGKRAAGYRNSLDRRLPDAGINAERGQTPAQHTNLHLVWAGLHVLIAVIGAFVVAAAVRAT